MTKIMTNLEIYNVANILSEAFVDDSMYMPAKLNFYIQKNRATITSLATDIENARDKIVMHYGSPTPEGGYQIPQESVMEANNELSELLAIEQEVNIYAINIEDLESMELTAKQMQALLFMINDPV